MKIKRLAAEAGRAKIQMAEVRASIVSLDDEDLLDLADIFSGKVQTFLGEAASKEVQRRSLNVEAI